MPSLALRPYAMALGLTLTAAIVAPPHASAQVFDVGATLGVGSSTVSWEATPIGGRLEDVQRRTSLVGGVFAALRLGSAMAVRAEAVRTERGFREVEADGDRTTLDVAYLQVPLLVGRSFGDGAVQPEIYAGPYLSWEVSCDVQGETSGVSVDFDCDEIPGDPVLRKTTDWGAVAGVALRFGNVDRVRAVLDLRYDLGLRNVDGAPDVDNLNIRHRALAAMLGVSVPLGR